MLIYLPTLGKLLVKGDTFSVPLFKVTNCDLKDSHLDVTDCDIKTF